MSPEDLAQRLGISEGEVTAFLCMLAREMKLRIRLVGLCDTRPALPSRGSARARGKAPRQRQPAYAGGHWLVARCLALIAHDNKKVDFVAWATYNRETLAQFNLIATRHTARLVRDKVGLEIDELLSGPEGGDAQIAALVATGAVDVVFFFVDPLWAQPHDPDIRALLRVCNVHNVPVATNLGTADLIITALSPEMAGQRGPADPAW
jgi:methylglyoxal synthase